MGARRRVAEQTCGQPDCRPFVGRDHVERCQEEVAHRVAGACAAVKAVLKRRRDFRRHCRERDEAVSDVARRKDPILLRNTPELPPSSAAVTTAVIRVSTGR